MKNTERPLVVTKEGLIYKVKKNHLGPKSQKEGKKKEIIIIIIKKKRRGSQSGQRTCSKDLG